MPAPLDYDQLLAQLTELATTQPATRTKREREAFAALLLIQGAMEVTDHELAEAARHLRDDHWTIATTRTPDGMVSWHLLDMDGNEVKPQPRTSHTGPAIEWDHDNEVS